MHWSDKLYILQVHNMFYIEYDTIDTIDTCILFIQRFNKCKLSKRIQIFMTFYNKNIWYMCKKQVTATYLRFYQTFKKIQILKKEFSSVDNSKWPQIQC